MNQNNLKILNNSSSIELYQTHIETLKYPTFNTKQSIKILIHNLELYKKYLVNDIIGNIKIIDDNIKVLYFNNYHNADIINKIIFCYNNINKKVLLIFDNIDEKDNDFILYILNNQYSLQNHFIIIKNNNIINLHKLLFNITYFFTQIELNIENINMLNKYEFKLFYSDKKTLIKILY